jgi:UDP-N-acetylglucosamine--N-acetylmuramyl-(pentapeptide) pyrophosphoryl-undecaprenol N-acetylglucosamine transferase
LFPGIAICRELQSRYQGCRILFVVGRRRMETDILHRHGFEVRHISVEGIKGKGWLKKLAAISFLPRSLLQARKLIAEAGPACVIGMGGYSSGPVCLAARLSGAASLVHEQNSFPGLTNRLLCRFVDRVCISFEDSASRFPAGKIVLTGNPVREEFFKIGERQAQNSAGFTLLVVGGSLGSRPVNEAVADALAILKKRRFVPRVIHQTGEADYERMVKRYQAKGLDVEIHRFIDNMADAYLRADLVVGRAGATTIFELAAAGRPSILIPYPFAADQHQKANAECLASTGGARIIMQQDLDGASLASLIDELASDSSGLLRMAAAARKIARPAAASAIVEEIESVMRERGKSL